VTCGRNYESLINLLREFENRERKEGDYVSISSFSLICARSLRFLAFSAIAHDLANPCG
jgi:hypothetical protein